MQSRFLISLLAGLCSLPALSWAAPSSRAADHPDAVIAETFSPAFTRQAERNVANLRVTSQEMAKASDEEKIVIWNPLSASITSGCAGSACVGSGCGLSGCAGSGCGLSGCAGSGCGGSACGGSACAGSACGLSGCIGSACGLSGCVGSACTQSGCVGSLCIVSGCAGSGCEVSGCLQSYCIGSICVASNCVGSVACGGRCVVKQHTEEEDAMRSEELYPKESVDWWVWFAQKSNAAGW